MDGVDHATSTMQDALQREVDELPSGYWSVLFAEFERNPRYGVLVALEGVLAGRPDFTMYDRETINRIHTILSGQTPGERTYPSRNTAPSATIIAHRCIDRYREE